MDEAPPAYGSPAPSFGSPAPDAVTPLNRSDISGAASQAEPRFQDRKDYSDQQDPAQSTISNVKSTLGGAVSNVTNALPTSSEDLNAQLSEAKNTILKLKQQVEDQLLKQKESDAVNQDSRERITTGMTGMGIQQQPADGVPVQIVAALCLLSFLLAYFFF